MDQRSEIQMKDEGVKALLKQRLDFYFFLRSQKQYFHEILVYLTFNSLVLMSWSSLYLLLTHDLGFHKLRIQDSLSWEGKEKERRWKRKSSVTAGKTWLMRKEKEWNREVSSRQETRKDKNLERRPIR